ncbi:MAG TPA: carbohydrate porin [Acetobacteraceae bacterium]|jgi:porin|nr:carbohydrate porin [Acetobacteraceae bacterium]
MSKFGHWAVAGCMIVAAAFADRALAQVMGPSASPAAQPFLTAADGAVPGAGAQPALPAAPARADPSPYQLNLLYTGELWDNPVGGLRQGSVYLYNMDGRLSVDAERAFGWTGGQFVLEGFYESYNSLNNTYVGATEEQSPIDSACCAIARLYQLYYDQNLGKTDLRFGIYDLETEFSNLKPMALFLSKNLTWNAALDQSGTASTQGTIGPGNYPYTPLALRIREELNPRWSVQFAAADGAADDPNRPQDNGVFFSSKYGAFVIGEVDYMPSRYTKLMAGGWGLTAKLPTNNMFNPDGSPRDTYGDEGGYIGATTRLYSAGRRRGLDAFFTAGLANGKSTDVNQSLNGGLVYTGLFGARPDDKLGFSFNVNGNPASYRHAVYAESGVNIGNYEPSFELTYRAKICDWLTVQPDMQYIVHPSYDRTLRNDFVIGLHFEIGHLFDL